ncbi:MAG: PHP domain-containing protein [Clostridia bacterium]|nr:PHP domain-containing protein [Clostridia bacterium]
MEERRWYKGDFHLHTVNSDGRKTPEELYEELYKKGLDFAFITDHNFNTVGEKAADYKGVGLYPGIEVSGNQGHVNVFGENMGLKSIESPRSPEAYNAVIDPLREKGAFVSVNHPFDRGLPWRMGFEDFRADSVEVWNAPMHTDDVKCMNWWREKLLDGVYIPAIGGSDFHRDFFVTRLVASPTTYVYAASKSMKDVLAAVKAGHVFVTNSPKAARLFLTCGQALPGDKVPFTEGATVNVSCDFLRRGQVLRVYHNGDEVFTCRAKRHKNGLSFDIPVTAPGFVRAEVRYQLGKVACALYRKGAAHFGRCDENEDVPEFIYSFTNPIFFE